MAYSNQNLQALFKDLRIDAAHTSAALDCLAGGESPFWEDLKKNVGKALNPDLLSRKETFLLALATALNEKNETLIKSFHTLAGEAGAAPGELTEVAACVSLMHANNVLFRAKHYLHHNEFYAKAPAGLRSRAKLDPILGKEFFALLSLGISALNGCEVCVQDNEAKAKDYGATESRIYEALRLISVIKSLCLLL